MNFIYGFLVAVICLAVVMELGFRAIRGREEREKRRYIWEREILQVGKEGSGLR